MTGRLWTGRVFARDGSGGNQTGVVLDQCADPAALATELGFPDTAFVQRHTGRSATVRTFSPHEELAQCIQTTLATPVALGAADGETWRVRHPGGVLGVRTEQTADGWLCWTADTDTAGEPERVDDLPDWLRAADVHRVPQGRSRLYARVPDVDELPAFDVTDVLAVCRAHDCTAVVFFGETGDVVRTRVFTTSLGGREDVATGGAAAGVGALLAREHRTGRIDVVQGAAERGHLLLSLGRERHVGGRVLPLPEGTRTTC
jgi:predicted PhzF superfamily epimerase YddE/YHI9